MRWAFSGATYCFFFYCYGDHRDLHSFPTRRSSDLQGAAEREAGEDELLRLDGIEHSFEIFELAAALVVHALGLADAAEVWPPGLVAELDEGARERLHDLVIERAAEQRVRMRDEGDALGRAVRLVDCAFDAAGRAGDELATGARPHYIRRRSTMRPFLTCSSMISSMSARST